jgi:hypothetical protein
MTLLDLPTALRARYNSAKPEHQEKIDARIQAIAVLSQAPRSAWESTAERLGAELTARFGRGFSAKRLLDLFRDYRKQGPGALLLDYRSEKRAKPEEFTRHLARLVGNNKRVSSVEIERVRGAWLAGQDVPGYGNWRTLWAAQHPDEPTPERCPDWFLPSGFSARNLSRLLPGEAALSLARGGYFAAHSQLPQKRNDYRELRPLEMVVFDDVRCDWVIWHPEHDRPVELWLLVAMDVATRVVLDWVSLAAVPDEDGKRAELLEEHMQILAGNLLRRYGIPSAYPMTLKVENAKATFREPAANYLRTLGGAYLKIDYTHMVTRRLPGGHEQRHGTPWDVKGVLESFFKTFHNQAASLPGQTGARYDLAPAELREVKREAHELLAECEDLPAEILAQLRLPVLGHDEAIATLDRLFAELNARTRHNLSGFEKLQLFRLPSDLAWRPIAELARYPAAVAREARLTRRMESPLERLARLLRAQPPFTIVPDDALLPLLARTIKRVRRPAPYTISWTQDGVEWLFRSTDIPQLERGEGAPYSVKLLPHDLTIAYLFDCDGRRLGAMHRVLAAGVMDEEAQKRALGEVMQARAPLVAQVDETHAPDRAAHEERRAHNRAVLDAARAGRAMVEEGAAAKAKARPTLTAAEILNARAEPEAD